VEVVIFYIDGGRNRTDVEVCPPHEETEP